MDSEDNCNIEYDSSERICTYTKYILAKHVILKFGEKPFSEINIINALAILSHFYNSDYAIFSFEICCF